MMKRVIWRANQVISIETRRRDENRKENVYVLAQMINRAQLLVFNLFNTDNNWENIDLNKAPILFCTYVTKQFISCSNIYKQKVEPLKEYKPPVYQIHMLGIRARKITLWEGTADEREIMFLGDGGGALIDGLDKLIEDSTGIKVNVASNSIEAVALGTGEVLKYASKLDNEFTNKEITLID